LQILLIEYGGDFMKTSPISVTLWINSIVLGCVTIPLGFLTRLLFPVNENPDSYFDNKIGQLEPDVEGRLRTVSYSGTNSGMYKPNSSCGNGNGNNEADDNSGASNSNELDQSPREAASDKPAATAQTSTFEMSPVKVLPVYV